MAILNLKIKDPNRPYFFIEEHSINPLGYTSVESDTLEDVSKAIVMSAIVAQILESSQTLSEVESILNLVANHYVVDTIAQRDALTPSAGMTVIVISGASGNREKYLYKDGAWLLIESASSMRMEDLIGNDFVLNSAHDGLFVRYNHATNTFTLESVPIQPEMARERIKQLYELNGNTNAFTDAHRSKLEAINLALLTNYAPLTHTHSNYALLFHDHNGLYAAISHNHDAVYAAATHHHDIRYELRQPLPASNGSLVARNTDGSITYIAPSAVGVQLNDVTTSTTSAWSSQKMAAELALKANSGHHHNALYAPLMHAHTDIYTKTEVDTIVKGYVIRLGAGNSIQERIDTFIQPTELIIRPASTAGIPNLGNDPDTLVVTHSKGMLAVEIEVWEEVSTGPLVNQGSTRMNLPSQSILKNALNKMSFGIIGLQSFARTDAILYVYVRFGQ